MNHEQFIWGHSRRFNSYTEYITKHFGGRVHTIFSVPEYAGTTNAAAVLSYRGGNFASRAFTKYRGMSHKSLDETQTDGCDNSEADMSTVVPAPNPLGLPAGFFGVAIVSPVNGCGPGGIRRWGRPTCLAGWMRLY